MSGSWVPLDNFPLTPYPDSQGGGLFGHKDNQHTLSPRESGNATPPTVKTLTVRGSHKTPCHTYNLLTLRTLHTNQRRLPRYWKWYDEHHPKQWVCGNEKLYIVDPPWWPLSNLSQNGAVLKKDISRLGPFWSLYDLTLSYSLLCFCNPLYFLYLYLPVRTSW